MKTNTEAKENTKTQTRPVKELRYKLTAAFIGFAVALMAILWIFQSVFLDRYYQLAMSHRCATVVKAVESYYKSMPEDTSYDEFIEYLGEKSSQNDLYIRVESPDGIKMDSSDSQIGGRMFTLNTRELLTQARNMLKESPGSVVRFSSESMVKDMKTYVYAKYAQISGSDRGSVYIFAIGMLTPLGPAVGIIRSQLLVVTAIALVIGIFVARATSKRLAKPIATMEIKARELAKGNYDVTFEGGDYKELSDLATTLNQTAQDLKASDALQKDLIANVSHDLRTPLTMIKSYAEMIRDLSGDNPEKRSEHLEVIINEADRLDDLVGDILMLSKMQAGVLEMEMEDFDLQAAAENVFSTYAVMEQEGFDLKFKRLPENIIVHGDMRKIQQVIANLMSNAIRYSKDVKEVELSFERSGNSVTCSVSDKGIGIDEEDQKKLWNRYQKASRQGTRSAQGTGLGLSIASEILEKHGAQYGVESVPGNGSRFWFTMGIKK